MIILLRGGGVGGNLTTKRPLTNSFLCKTLDRSVISLRRWAFIMFSIEINLEKLKINSV